jgi:hypothetical protein
MGNVLDLPATIAVDSSDNVYVTGRLGNNAFEITPGGIITAIIDASGDGMGNVLDGPFAIAVDSSDDVYVSACSSDNAFQITRGNGLDCSRAVPSMDVLWPPNHRYRPVSVEGVTDSNGDPVAITITSLAQDEPTQAVGSGHTCPDGQGLGTSVARVRSERSGTRNLPGDGRVYHVGFTAADSLGRQCAGVVSVCVPHDQAASPICIDQGPLHDSTLCSENFPGREPCTTSDIDGDGVCDAEDRCLVVADWDQEDADSDGIGDACDADFSNDGVVGAPDYLLLLAAFGAQEGDPRFDYALDMGGDGVIGVAEYLLLAQTFGGQPGPSGLGCAGLVPCP